MNASKMYRFICFLVLYGLAESAPSIKDSNSINPVLDKCTAEVGVDRNYRMHNLTESIINDPKAKCLIGCLWRENRWLKDDGSLNPAKWIERMSHFLEDLDEPIRAINECSKENDENLCEMVFKFFMCYNAKKLAALYKDTIVSTTPYMDTTTLDVE